MACNSYPVLSVLSLISAVPLNIQGNAGENPAYMASDVGKARDIEVDLPNPLYTDKGCEGKQGTLNVAMIIPSLLYY